ncbi:MAG: class I SAM-dependent methyltransferase [Acholeplasmataceae bacterium]|nr:class I SAM-dependent methyltransferase [Acholeplasmataceae bacterium]
MIACKICGKDTKSYSHPKTNEIFHECKYCEFIFKDESHYISNDQELKIYDAHHNDDHNLGYVNFLMNFIDAAVLPYIKKGRVLDFGSGPTPLLSKLIKKSGQFDVDIYDLYYAKQKIYENQEYDLITSTEVIEHLKYPMQTFKLFFQLLKPDGILSMMTLFHPHNQNEFFEWFYIRDKSHVSFYTQNTMRYIAKQIGFEFIYSNDYRYVVFKKKSE